MLRDFFRRLRGPGRVVRQPDGSLRFRFRDGLAGRSGAIGHLPPPTRPIRLRLDFAALGDGVHGYRLVLQTLLSAGAAVNSGEAPADTAGAVSGWRPRSRVPAAADAYGDDTAIDTFADERSAAAARKALERALLGRAPSPRWPAFAAGAVAGIALALSALALPPPSTAPAMRSTTSPTVASAAAAPPPAAPAAPSAGPTPGVLSFGPGRHDPNRSIIVFSDPQCPACRYFDREIAELNRLGIDVHVVPVAFQKGSSEAVRNIMCAADPKAAWTRALEGRAAAAAADCERSRAAAANNNLFAAAGFNQTPTIVLPGDRKIEGAVQAARIVAQLGAP